MTRSLASLIGLAAALTACGVPEGPIRTAAGNLTQGQVDQIVRDCGAPAGTITFDGPVIVIAKHEDIHITGCVLKALEATGETSLPSVGNQRYEVPEKQ
ncbi:hypothetical protein [Croceicoccus sp. Ery5]|uniref:hypothetical protein n=1 Tax=Croceicoccus sp. Ery5 TaxID=1703340 RepID=UPI001E64340B|nr:hypothetical protein [Croceicoccus sp. Ery5]